MTFAGQPQKPGLLAIATMAIGRLGRSVPSSPIPCRLKVKGQTVPRPDTVNRAPLRDLHAGQIAGAAECT